MSLIDVSRFYEADDGNWPFTTALQSLVSEHGLLQVSRRPTVSKL